MNLIAQQALVRARTHGARPVPVADVLPPDPVPVTRPVTPPVTTGDRLSYLEGRRHALDMARDYRLMIEIGSTQKLTDRLRQCMQGKPVSFARGVIEIIELLESEVNRG